MHTHSRRGSIVTGREYRPPPGASVRKSGGDSNRSEWARWDPSWLGWTGTGLFKAFWIRKYRGKGSWEGGSVVGLGGSTWGTSGGGWARGGVGGIWVGGGESASEFEFLLSSDWAGGGAEAGAGTEMEVGPGDGGSGWLAEGSSEWCLVTGVILFGGMGGDRLTGTGTWEGSTVEKINKKIQSK